MSIKRTPHWKDSNTLCYKEIQLVKVQSTSGPHEIDEYLLTRNLMNVDIPVG